MSDKEYETLAILDRASRSLGVEAPTIREDFEKEAEKRLEAKRKKQRKEAAAEGE